MNRFGRFQGPFATLQSDETEAAWSPADAFALAPGGIIESLDPDVHRTGGTLSATGEIVDAWNTKGPAGQLMLTSSGTCRRRVVNGVPYLEFPATSAADVFRAPNPVDIMGTEIWMLAHLASGSASKSGLVGADTTFGDRAWGVQSNGDFDAVGTSGNFLRQNPGALPLDTWFLFRLRSEPSQSTLWVNGTLVDQDANTFTAFMIQIIGGMRESANTFPWTGGIHSIQTVLGTSSVELETNLNDFYGPVRDQMNGV
ncbi:MAG: hypothetical protein AAF479_10965 [Pseudomonadota bacterium]